eukprot:comp14729_c0_seq1/m.11123 comp14729_c0_seq1/g.11123  ORF comp14729_c0_seq1/g.11123 comp14729_c0_seq1/m.11123 type:complete len:222 (-) comp14729_c0_seq1:543-1208(-)
MARQGGTKPNCLVVVSAHSEGVSAPSFIHCYTIASSVFTVDLASPSAGKPNMINADDKAHRWLLDFQKRKEATPLDTAVVDGSQYAALILPNSPGGLWDLGSCSQIGAVVAEFLSQNKPVCAIGCGVAGLCPAKAKDGSWALSGYCIAAPTVFEQAKLPNFDSLPVVLEDYVRDNRGVFSGSTGDSSHVCIDRNLITGQNDNSTLTAVQNLILMYNTRRPR